MERTQVFGIHSITAYDRETRLPLGNAKVVGSVTATETGEVVENHGGSNPHAWGLGQGQKSMEVQATLRELPSWLFEVVTGVKPTLNAAEDSGFVGNLAGAKGSIIDATGIDSVAAKTGGEANLKSGRYVIKAETATTVHVYALTDADFDRGTALKLLDDEGRITETALTVTASSAVEIPGLGVEITGGSGVIGMTVDDTAVFDVRAINTGSKVAKMGKARCVKPFGLLVTAQKNDGEIYYLDLYKIMASNLPNAFTEKEFMETELELRAGYDEDRGDVWEMNLIHSDC